MPNTYKRKQVLAGPPDNPLGRSHATKQLVHVADISSGRATPRNMRDVLAVDAVRERMLAVPMLKEDELVGAFVIFRQEVRPFTDKQIELVTELRRAGGHRHREHAAAQRAARIAPAADRHRRRAQGHQPLDLRSSDGARHAD